MSYQSFYVISHTVLVNCHISSHSSLSVTIYQLDVISVFILRYKSHFISQMSYQCSFYDISHILSFDISGRCHISVHFIRYQSHFISLYHISVHSTLSVTIYQIYVISVFILRYQSRFISQMSYQCSFYVISHILSVRCHISVHSTILVTIYQLYVISELILRYQSHFIRCHISVHYTI